LIVSIILFAINILLFLFSKNSIFLLFLATNIYGVAFDLFSITTYKGAFDNSLKKDKARNISFLESFYNLGLLLGSLIAGFIVAYNLNNAAYLCLGILLFLLVIVLMIGKEKITHKKLSLTTGYKETFFELKNLGFIGVFLIFILIFINTWDGFFFVFEPIFAKKFSGYFINELIIGGILLAIYTLPSILLERTFGKLEDKYGKKWFIVYGLLLSSFFIFVIQMTDNVIITAISIFLLSLGFFAIAKPASECLYETIAENKFGKKHIGNYAGVIEMTLSIGFLLGPLLGGFFLSRFGDFNLAFRIFAIFTMILASLSIFVIKD
jgi:MFS family permease